MLLAAVEMPSAGASGTAAAGTGMIEVIPASTIARAPTASGSTRSANATNPTRSPRPVATRVTPCAASMACSNRDFGPPAPAVSGAPPPTSAAIVRPQSTRTSTVWLRSAR